tara:strand:- start:5497 stop:5976 length:480 start_codon:yes stop_codon:yes gene_type:complete
MKNFIATAAAVLLMTTSAFAAHDNGKGKSNHNRGATGAQGETGATGATGARGARGARGATGAQGDAGAAGAAGATGAQGEAGATGKGAVAPLGALSFSSASASFYGDGIGFGLSNSNYGSLEGSIVVGYDLGYDWRVVAGITTDFNDKHAVSVGVGYSF